MCVVRFSYVFTILSIFAIFIIVSPVFSETSEEFASTTIMIAEESVISAYEAVLEAEQAGGNVTGLLGVMNEAGWLLSRAKLAYQIGDFESARASAVQSQDRLSGFVEEAEGLKGSALQQRFWDFMVNIVGSIVGTVAVVGGSLVAWFLLKRKFGKAGNVV